MNIIKEVGKLTKEQFISLMVYIYSSGACDVYCDNEPEDDESLEAHLTYMVAEWLGLDLFEEGDSSA